MSQLLEKLTSGYRERVNRLAIFDPLYELSRKVSKDQQGNSIDWFSLGLLALLFFFESMLARRRQTSVIDLAEYIRFQNKAGPVVTDQAGFLKIAREIITAFRDASGKRKTKSFYNWETRQQETIYYSLLEVRESDLARNVQYYRLTERGLELIFATKEYFSEFHISINQLLLRKQLEKGELNGALREIDEMRVAVEELHRKIQQLGNEVQRNIISHQTQDKYMKLLADTYSRLAREHEEFKELYHFVLDTKNRLGYQINSDKERQSYNLIILIARELDAVHHQHRELLHESISLKRKALKAAQDSLYHAGLISFSFNQDITSRIVTSPLPLGMLAGLLRPFLGTYVQKSWSPGELFAAQRLGKEETGADRQLAGFAEADETIETVDFYRQQRHNFKVITGLLRIGDTPQQNRGMSPSIQWKIINGKPTICLSAVIAAIQANDDYRPLLAQRSFYDYWLLLHQRSPLIKDAGDSEEVTRLLDAIINEWPGVEELVVVEDAALLNPHPRYQIQEMILTVRMKADAT